MTETPTPLAPEDAPAQASAEGDEEEGRTRLPRVVVRMSDAMKEALDKWIANHEGAVATAIARDLLATHIGFDLSKDPDAPGSGTRTKYADDASREAGKLRNRKKASLLRQALFHMHQAALKKRPALQGVAMATVTTLASDTITLAEIEAAQTTLEDAIKAGK